MTYYELANYFSSDFGSPIPARSLQLIYTSACDTEVEEDEDVAEERERMLREGHENHALAVMGLTKFYGRRCCAVRELTFGVGAEECFGLLGEQKNKN